VFGEIAELYDHYRPAYPERLVDDLVELVPLDAGEIGLEVGAGTGQATAMFAERGIQVVAVEPSAEMAAVAHRNCSAYPGVMIEESDFEHWDRSGREFPLGFSAQAWHWVVPEVKYAERGRRCGPVASWRRSGTVRCGAGQACGRLFWPVY